MKMIYFRSIKKGQEVAPTNILSTHPGQQAAPNNIMSRHTGQQAAPNNILSTHTLKNFQEYLRRLCYCILISVCTGFCRFNITHTTTFKLKLEYLNIVTGN